MVISGTAEFASVFLTDQLRYLKIRGFDITLICAPGELLTGVQQHSGCEILPVTIDRSIHMCRDLISLLQLCRDTKRLYPDIVHTHTPKAGLLGTAAAWLNRVPVRIHTFHGLRSETLSGPKRLVVEAMEKLTAMLATDCLAVSESLRDELITRGICPAHKLQVLGYGSCAGIDTAYFSSTNSEQARRDFRNTYQITEDTLLITYIGRICHEKGIDTLIRAWKQLKTSVKATLLIAGPFDSTDPVYPETLHAMTLENGVLLKPQFVKDISKILAASDICVQPSFREGLGVSALEAAAMGIPVIASKVTGLVDAVRHQQTGLLVPSRDENALVQALQQLIEDAPQRTAMGTAGRQFVLERFNRHDVFLNLSRYYEGVITTKQCLQRNILKRAFDFAAASILLLTCSPILLIVMAILRWHLGSSAIFRQQRAGRNGRIFSLLKLKTMKDIRDENGVLLPDHMRLSTFGKWLRMLSIDELPQLWNVIRGDMSMVGPRPLLAEYLPHYTSQQARRHEVKPGITGWAQVHGRNLLSWQDKFAYDVWYVDHRSFLLDIKVLLLTFRKLFTIEGITPHNAASMPDFRRDSAGLPADNPLFEI